MPETETIPRARGVRPPKRRARTPASRPRARAAAYYRTRRTCGRRRGSRRLSPATARRARGGSRCCRPRSLPCGRAPPRPIAFRAGTCRNAIRRRGPAGASASRPRPCPEGTGRRAAAAPRRTARQFPRTRRPPQARRTQESTFSWTTFYQKRGGLEIYEGIVESWNADEIGSWGITGRRTTRRAPQARRTTRRCARTRGWTS